MLDKRKLSIREKADYVPAFLSIGGTALTAPVTGLMRGSDGADTYKHHIMHSIIRKFNSRLNSLQSQSVQPSFLSVYKKWCRSNNTEPDIVDTAEGVRGFWIGDRTKAKYVVAYYHGGGFAIPGSEGHIKFWSDVQSFLNQHGTAVAFFFVTYTLTPHGVWPTQLQEAIGAVEYLVERCHYCPSQILLGGDSAGGNLAVATLLHMSEACTEIENDYTVRENLKGLVLMAPWLSFRTDWPSFTKNKNKDYIEADVEGRWSAEYLGVQPKPSARLREVRNSNPDILAHSPYAEPCLAPASAWAASKCDNILVVYGGLEALSDSIEDWVSTYEEGIGKDRVDQGGIHVFVGTNEVHIAPIIWPLFGESRETESGAEIKRWMLEKLS